MKIIVDSIKEINRAWQCVAYGRSEEPRLLEDADKLLMSILNRADREENNIERILDDVELKYLRILEKDRTQVHAVQAVQTIREKLSLKSITDEIKETKNINNKEDLTKEVLLELLLVLCDHSHPDTPIISQKAWELWEKLGGNNENIS